jgi:hypothetical protein
MDNLNKGLPSYGTKYEARKAELVQLIKDDSISSIEIEAEQVIISGRPADIMCYFCLDRISGEMHLLEEKILAGGKHELTRRYYVHDSCYHQAKDGSD